MKRIITLCAAMATLATSCTESAGHYHIKGSVANQELEGSTIYLREIGVSEKTDSAVVTNGLFEMKGDVENPTVFTLLYGRESTIVLTGATTTVAIGEETTVKQGEEQETIAKLDSEIDVIVSEFYDFCRQNSNDEKLQYAKYEEISAQIEALQDSYLENNRDNLIGAYVIAKKSNDSETLEELDSLTNLAPLSKGFAVVKKNRDNKLQALKTAVGEMYADFDGTDMDGNSIKLSDYVGKGNYVLVDFWASWCGPCRAEMPNLKSVYDKHKENGLVLLGVNVWDKKDACTKAIEEENMTWDILYASDDTEATTAYGILGIPTIILFGPDGKIVDRTARGPQIMELLDSIYNK